MFLKAIANWVLNRVLSVNPSNNPSVKNVVKFNNTPDKVFLTI